MARRIPITVTLFLWTSVSENSDEDTAQFMMEEGSRCFESAIKEVADSIVPGSGMCHTCWKAEVRVGHRQPPPILEVEKFEEWPVLIPDDDKENN